MSYHEDVDVFSFGLLKAKQDSLEVEINIGNLTEACKSHFISYLAQHISKVVQRNSSVTDNVINTSEGYICHSQLEKDEVKESVIYPPLSLDFHSYVTRTTILIQPWLSRSHM